MPDEGRRPLVSRKARDDLSVIWRYGAERWSEDQADQYANGLQRTFDLLRVQPLMARERHDIGPGIRVHPHGAHLIFYRILEDRIQIVRVVPSRSDWTSALDL